MGYDQDHLSGTGSASNTIVGAVLELPTCFSAPREGRVEVANDRDAKHAKNLGLMDKAIHDEAVDLFVRLAPPTYSSRSTLLLNAPTPKDRLAITGGVRALGNSQMLHFLVPSGVVAARLYYLVAFLEGVVMPHLQVLLDLCEQEGCVGKITKGRTELELARPKLSLALGFLATTGAPTLSNAPKLHAELQWASLDKIPQLRNAVAHFKFRIEEATTDAETIPSVKALGTIRELGLHATKGLAKLLGIPAFDTKHVPVYESSYVQYEEDINRPLLPGSRRRSYADLRTALERIERLGFSLLFAFLTAGGLLKTNGKIMLGECGSCGTGIRAGIPGSTVECPVCGASWTFC